MITKILEEVNSPNGFKRVDESHILDIFVGLNYQNKPTIIIKIDYVYEPPKGSKYVDIFKYEKEGFHFYGYSITDLQFRDIFIKIFDDVIEKSRQFDDVVEAFIRFNKRYILWSKMFLVSKSDKMSKNEIVGLYGELYFLFSNFTDLEDAVKYWHGPLKERKDFVFSNSWSEIKCTKNGNNSVKISSIEQLDDVLEGELIVYEYEEVEDDNSTNNIYLLVEFIFQKINSSEIEEDFASKLSAYGYSHEEYYRDFSFAIKKESRIKITEQSEVVRRKKLPKLVENMNYSLLYKQMRGYNESS